MLLSKKYLYYENICVIITHYTVEILNNIYRLLYWRLKNEKIKG